MKPTKLLAALMGAAILCLGTVLQPAPAKKAKAAPVQKEATTPQEAVHKVCDGCHNTEIVMDTPKDYDEWKDTIDAMIDRGARGRCVPHRYDR